MRYFSTTRNTKCTHVVDLCGDLEDVRNDVRRIVYEVLHLMGRNEKVSDLAARFVTQYRGSNWSLTVLETEHLFDALTPAELTVVIELRSWSRRDRGYMVDISRETGGFKSYNYRFPEANTSWSFNDLNTGKGVCAVALFKE